MIYRAYGGPERLELTDIPRPSPGPGQVLVRVIASSVNPIDWKLASGMVRLFMPVKFPAVPGFDIAGDVAELGRGVTGYAIGDRVHARIAWKEGTGACADFAVVGWDVLAKAPAGMDPGEAAALPLAGLTALQGLRDRAGLPLEDARERVLVVGASGGVGHLGVQIARAAGATVVGVCSERNAPLVSSLGAHDVIDYKKPDPYRGQPLSTSSSTAWAAARFPGSGCSEAAGDTSLPCPAPARFCGAC
jgi:NADPH:quinone reductase-like Zn-dependent oxidoreductase